MKTKSEIVERLLNEKQITAEEAVVLLTGEKEYVYHFPQPIYPSYPNYWYVNPFPYTITYTVADTAGSITLNSPNESK